MKKIFAPLIIGAIFVLICFVLPEKVYDYGLLAYMIAGASIALANTFFSKLESEIEMETEEINAVRVFKFFGALIFLWPTFITMNQFSSSSGDQRLVHSIWAGVYSVILFMVRLLWYFFWERKEKLETFNDT